MKKTLLLILLALLTLTMVPPAFAHPADMYYHVHTLHFTPDGIAVEWTITPGTLLAYVVWDDADTSGDDAVSADEARQWLEPRIRDLYWFQLDGQPVAWQIEALN